VNPCLTLADGIEAMQGQGPIHGTPYPLGVILASTDMTALDRVAAEIVNFPINKVYALEAARLRGYGNYNLDKIEISGVTDLSSVAVADFEPARAMDISFNPYRIMKSLLKQFYEVGIKEKRDIFN
jgi:uncharacterized protein (DUF362 family)